MASSSQKNVISHVTSDSVVDGVPDPLPYHHDYFPIFSSLSKTHWELWIFDGVDPNGNAAVTMTFFRDGSQLALGKGPLRATLNAAFPDGTTIRIEEFANESIISAGTESITGIWRSVEGSDSPSVRFEVQLDRSEAVVIFDIPALKGTLRLSEAVSSPTTNGPGSTTDQLLGPGVYYVHSIIRAAAEVDFTFPEQGKGLQFSGYGGGDHSWMTNTTFSIIEGCTYARGHAGPYTFSLMRIFSRIETDKTYIKAVLVRDGKQIFTCTSDDRVSLDEDYVCFRSTQGGPIRGDFSDVTSGYQLDLVSPSAQKHWSFDLKHHCQWWSMATGPPSAKTGNNGFIDLVTGGEVGGPVHTGAVTVGQVQLPLLKSQYKGFNNPA